MPTAYSMNIAGAAALSAALSVLAGGCRAPGDSSPAAAEPPESRSANGAGEATGSRGGETVQGGAAGAPARVDPAPAQLQAMMDRTRKHATVTAGFANTMAAFAAPRVIARAKSLPSREEVLRCIDAYLEVIAETKQSPRAEGNQATINAEPYALKLRDLVAAWTPATTVPAAIQQNARDVLGALGIPEPPEGWDLFEGDAASSSP